MGENNLDSTFILSKLKDVLSDKNFDYASAVITYCETKSLIYNYIGMAEFRDALTHIKRGINSTNKENLLSELDSAYEHIRRAAAESMQSYVESKYLDLRKRLKSPYLYFFKIGYFLDRKRIMESEKIIRNNIFSGREAKPKKEWQEAISYFYNAEIEIDKINTIVPSREQIDQRAQFFALILIFLVLLIVNMFRIV